MQVFELFDQKLSGQRIDRLAFTARQKFPDANTSDEAIELYLADKETGLEKHQGEEDKLIGQVEHTEEKLVQKLDAILDRLAKLEKRLSKG